MTTIQAGNTQLQVTWRAQEALESVGYTAEELAERHASGDWGTISEQERDRNRQSHGEQAPIFSSYRLNGMTVIWVITSADRSVTAVLTPSDSAVYRKML